MKTEFKCRLDNGWLVYEDNKGKGILIVEPLENSLFRQHKVIELPDAIFNDIKNGMTEIKELFQKHKLHNLIVKWETIKPTDKRFVNTETKYYGRGYNVYKEGNKYYLILQLSSHGGGSRKIEINKEVFEYAQNDKLIAQDILDKFNLHHLDVPDNDVNE